MGERREIEVPIAAEDYEALHRVASSRGVKISHLISEAVDLLTVAAFTSSRERRKAGARALLDTELAIDWGSWEELEREILDARG